eukprot:TRINITY_DN24759_c0_g1_i1.p1 TRINITY_DN24759_c0_g1~~TRINITY_DN24759_c0_g1_i1.p1  ORF type:complete len:202 (+),score=39.74 TRINITY_DN24759_c0_g1_i1:73-606(+)
MAAVPAAAPATSGAAAAAARPRRSRRTPAVPTPESCGASPPQLARAALCGGLLRGAVTAVLGSGSVLRVGKLEPDAWRTALAAAARAQQGLPAREEPVGQLLAVSSRLVGLSQKDRLDLALSGGALRSDVANAVRRYVRWELLTPQQHQWLCDLENPQPAYASPAPAWPTPDEVDIP